MANDSHVDGNAIGGLLIEVFGREMTDAVGRCANCGTVNPVARLVVYRSGPGDVVRCPVCSIVVIVATPGPDRPRVYFSALRWLEPPA
jgi:uncharacterized Zn finger protein